MTDAPILRKSQALAEFWEIDHGGETTFALAISDPQVRRWTALIEGPKGRHLGHGNSPKEALQLAWNRAHNDTTQELDSELETHHSPAAALTQLEKDLGL